MSDKREVREFMLSLLDLGGIRTVLDIGCGKGRDLKAIGESMDVGAHLLGVDVSDKAVDAARELVADDPRFAFVVHDVSAGLPFEDETFDLVYSVDLLECITDKDSLVREVSRVLRPGGQVAFAHWDWDSQVIDGEDKDLVRKIVHAFGDWKQAWMTDCDSWMGRRLWRVFNRSGLFTGAVRAYVITDTEFTPGRIGYERVKDFEALVRRDMISCEEYDRFYRDIQALAEKGEYFFSTTVYAYVGAKIQ